MQKSKVMGASILGAALAVTVFLGGCGGGTESENPAEVEPQKPLQSIYAQYGPHAQNIVKLVLPSNEEAKGLVVWVHGGGWFKGDLEEESAVINKLNAQGLAVLAANYRLVPEGAFPAANEDINTVLNAVQSGGCQSCDNPELWQTAGSIAKDKGWLTAGASAGSTLAVDATLRLLEQRNDLTLKCVNAVVGFTDFRQPELLNDETREMVYNYAGRTLEPSRLEELSPIIRLESLSPKAKARLANIRWFSRYSQRDAYVPFSLTGAFEQKLRSFVKQVDVAVIDRPDLSAGHAIDLEDLLTMAADPARDCFNAQD